MGSASTPNLTGLPGGGDGTSKTEREVARKLELEAQIRDLIADEAKTRKEDLKSLFKIALLVFLVVILFSV